MTCSRDVSGRAERPAASKPQWEIVRISKRLDYFEGIEARDSSEAIALFQMGHGALNQERTEDAPYEFRAVRVG